MSTQPNLTDKLRQGIEAARTGKEAEARNHLIAVLKQDPNNIPALLWLAFVLPAPQDTIRLLQRVLALDPTNERARAGIRWARERLGLPPEEVQPVNSDPQPVTASADTGGSGDSIRSILLSEEVQEKSKKGALAHRARRTINPFIGTILIIIGLGVIGLGLNALLFGPPQTLAAWMPAVPEKIPVQAALPTAAPAQEAEVVAVAPPPIPPSLTSSSDSIILPAKPAKTALTKPHLPAELAQALILPELPAKVEPIYVDPLKLVGPIGPMPSANPAKVSVGKPQLAYQPTQPDEKWIEVNVTTQQLIAWEGEKPVMFFTVSTGLPGTPTVLGQYHIYWKLTSTLMTGYNYYLPDVPYTMYFYGGYGLHGTYWHSNFGQPMSHGCVNLKTEEAKQLFEWAGPTLPAGQTQVEATADNPGTLVVVRE
ncbi:MAG: L,D-transpeptidase family protein [Anaerolineae bacterium]